MKRDGNTARGNDLGGTIRLCSPTSFVLPLFLLLVGPLANIGAGQTSPSDDSYITRQRRLGTTAPAPAWRYRPQGQVP